VEPWTRRQRVAVVVLCGLIVSIAVSRYATNRAYVANPQPIHPLHEDQLADRIDPNTADAATLSALPLIGDKRAEDIVRYREHYAATHGGKLAFERPADLLLIHGVGAATLKQLEPFLVFPGTPATQETK